MPYPSQCDLMEDRPAPAEQAWKKLGGATLQLIRAATAASRLIRLGHIALANLPVRTPAFRKKAKEVALRGLLSPRAVQPAVQDA